MPTPSVGDAISLLALIMSAWALIVTSRFNKQQLQLMKNQDALAKRQLEAEAIDQALSKKADLNAELVKVDIKSWRLVVTNVGRATARNVQVVEASERSLLVSNDVRAKLPYELLEPGGQFQLVASVHMGTKPKIPIRLNWEDDSSSENDKVVPVSF